MKRLIGGVIIAVLLLSASLSSVEARSGCCSHHGGVCGCGCCDGTGLSATCLPYYPHCIGGGGSGGGVAPTREPPVNTENPIKEGRINIVQSATRPYFSVSINWDSTLPVSIGISKAAGANPGSLIDTDKGFYQFEKITSGRWYINLKAHVGGRWTDIRYWTVDVPGYIDPTNTPTPTKTPTPTLTPSPAPTNVPTETPIQTTEPEVKGVHTEASFFSAFISFFQQLFK